MSQSPNSPSTQSAATPLGADLHRAVALLKDNQVVAAPTETVYGLAGNAFSSEAVTRIFEVKNRPRFDPLIVHIAGPDRLAEVARETPAAAQRLLERFWPGPLTLVLPRTPQTPDLVTAGLDTVAVRLSAHPMLLELLRQLPFPLAAPSANPFGYVSPTTAQHVAEQLGGAIPYILDGGPCHVGLESTIVGFTSEGQPELLRQGGISQEAIEGVVGPVTIRDAPAEHPSAPGMLASHYAPHTHIVLQDLEKLLNRYSPGEVGALRWETYTDLLPRRRQRLLCPDGLLTTAAHNLFAALRELDQQGLQVIQVSLGPEHGLGRAINDRLRRAATPRSA